MPKHIKSTRGGKPAPTDTLTIDILRGEAVEEVEFTVRPQVSFGGLAAMIRNSTAQDPAQQALAVPQMVRLITKCMIDSDGTPAKWQPTVVQGKFTTPDGKEAPADQLDLYTTPAAGSSRRRWVYLMEEDDEATIESEQIVGVLNWLTGEAASQDGATRPTRRSSS